MILAVRWVGATAARSGTNGTMAKSLPASTGVSSRLPGRSSSTVS